MKRYQSWSLLIGLLVLGGLVDVAVAQQPKSGGTLRIAWEQDVTGFDPHWSAGLQNIYMAGNLFNGLVTFDEHLNYVAELAESWEVQDNGKVYVFRLHKGVKFHDGTDFDAAAVAWNFERIMDPEEKALARPLLEVIAAVEPLDALWDQIKQAPTPEEFSRLSQEVQRYIVRNMVQMSVTTLPFIQAARDSVKGYVYERGLRIRFATTWLDKPQR